MLNKMEPGQVRYVAAVVLHIDGDEVRLHPQTIFFESRRAVHKRGNLDKGWPTLKVRCDDDGEMLCEIPPEDSPRLQRANNWVRRDGAKVTFVDADGDVYDGIPDFLK